MSAINRTPGVWYADGDLVCVDQGDFRHVLANVTPNTEVGPNINAVLMAESPALVALLRECRTALNEIPNRCISGDRNRTTYALINKIERSLKKLEG